MGSGPSLRVRDRLATSRLPQLMPAIAATWQETVLSVSTAEVITQAAKERSSEARKGIVNKLRALNQQAGRAGGW